ncbi:hypothetical protein E2C01_082561 [Portunus trituberculatus]|uniref:Uncharacterized protein n=1 Tax=Portunus trituberculatus TaxID=210409 RepID=A0A5B7IZG4_PORTR|nr:hypothetical protein [Portunus trituberculatus]
MTVGWRKHGGST